MNLHDVDQNRKNKVYDCAQLQSVIKYNYNNLTLQDTQKVL